MKKICICFLCMIVPVLSFAQRHVLEWEITGQPAVLYKSDPKSRSDSVNHVVKYHIKQDSMAWSATIIVKVVDDKIDSLSFRGTILRNKLKIRPKEYCIYVMDDGLHDQLIIMDSPSYMTKEIRAGNDNSVPRFEGGKQYTISVWAKVNEKPKNFRVDYDPEFKLYSGIGLNPLLQLAPTINVGFDCNRWNVWFSASHSVATSDAAFVYDSANKLLGKHQYHNLRLGINAGWEWEPWEHDLSIPLFSVMPQVGIAWDHTYSSEKDVSGNGFNLYNFLAGARIALKTNNRHWCFFVTPEFNLNLGSNPIKNYENITESINGLKKSFDVQVGVLYYF